MLKISPKERIVPGTIWIYLPTGLEIKPTDIICKIIRVTDTHVYLIRKTHFGFKDLDPLIVQIETFYDNYLYLAEEVE